MKTAKKIVTKWNFLIQHSIKAATKKNNSALLNRVKTESEEKQKSKQQENLNQQLFQQK